jgi:hypothetical protein
MNVANLQLEGLLMAIASVNNALVQKGVLTIEELDTALRAAERSISGDVDAHPEMPPANRDAACFPVRLLRLANLGGSDTSVQTFSELTRLVGQNKKDTGKR